MAVDDTTTAAHGSVVTTGAALSADDQHLVRAAGTFFLGTSRPSSVRHVLPGYVTSFLGTSHPDQAATPPTRGGSPGRRSAQPAGSRRLPRSGAAGCRCSARCSTTALTCGAGSTTARTSTSALTPAGWPRASTRPDRHHSDPRRDERGTPAPGYAGKVCPRGDLPTYDTGCDPAIEAVNASHAAPDTFRGPTQNLAVASERLAADQ